MTRIAELRVDVIKMEMLIVAQRCFYSEFMSPATMQCTQSCKIIDIMLYAFFWVIPRRLNFICRRFGTLFHLHTYPSMKREQSIPKRRHIKFRRRGITQRKAYNIQNTAEVWNQKYRYFVWY